MAVVGNDNAMCAMIYQTRHILKKNIDDLPSLPLRLLQLLLKPFCECIILCELKTCALYSSEAIRGHNQAFHKFLLQEGIKTNEKNRDKNARRVNHHIKVVVSLGYLSKNLLPCNRIN